MTHRKSRQTFFINLQVIYILKQNTTNCWLSLSRFSGTNNRHTHIYIILSQTHNHTLTHTLTHTHKSYIGQGGKYGKHKEEEEGKVLYLFSHSGFCWGKKINAKEKSAPKTHLVDRRQQEPHINSVLFSLASEASKKEKQEKCVCCVSEKSS